MQDRLRPEASGDPFDPQLTSDAIKLLREAPGPYLFASLFAFIPLLGGIAWWFAEWFWHDFQRNSLLLMATVSAAGFAVGFSIFLCGSCRMALNQLSGQRPGVKDLLGSLPIALTSGLALNLILGAAILGTSFLLFVPGLLLATFWFLALPRLMTGYGLCDSLGWSWAQVKARLMAAFGVCNVVHLAGVSGGFVCCLPGLITFPIYPIAQAVSYCRLEQSFHASNCSTQPS